MSDAPAPLLILIGDGLGDRPIAAFGGRTPLEATPTPTLDWLATNGECGLMDPIGPGIRAGSDTAHLAILGYDPYEVYTGRGPFEAAGIGMEVKPGDVAFRCNFTTIDDDFIAVDRRAGRIEEGTDQLVAEVNEMVIEDVTCFVKESVAHRAALVLRGPGLSAEVTDVDPHHEGAKLLEAEAKVPAAEKTARILNEFVRRSYAALKNHPVNQARIAAGLKPANSIVPRGAGEAPNIGSIEARYGCKSACIVETGLIKGIGNYLGMDILDVPGGTGGLDTDIQSFAAVISEALPRYGLILCNLKAPDIAGHDSGAETKQQAIRLLDQLVAGLLEAVKTTGAYMVVTGDHSTPIGVGDHSGDPLPVVFYGPDVRADSVTEFGERSCAAGVVCRIKGKDLMPILTQFNNTQVKFGA